MSRSQDQHPHHHWHCADQLFGADKLRVFTPNLERATIFVLEAVIHHDCKSGVVIGRMEACRPDNPVLGFLLKNITSNNRLSFSKVFSSQFFGPMADAKYVIAVVEARHKVPPVQTILALYRLRDIFQNWGSMRGPD